MILYHGSTLPVERSKNSPKRGFLDFGTGFYTTTSYRQAERWAKIKMRRLNTDVGYVSVYKFDYDAPDTAERDFSFSSRGYGWLRFVVGNRRGEELFKAADLHIGPVADDNIYRSIRLFETGVLDSEETVKRLKTEGVTGSMDFPHRKNPVVSFLY